MSHININYWIIFSPESAGGCQRPLYCFSSLEILNADPIISVYRMVFSVFRKYQRHSKIIRILLAISIADIQRHFVCFHCDIKSPLVCFHQWYSAHLFCFPFIICIVDIQSVFTSDIQCHSVCFHSWYSASFNLFPCAIFSTIYSVSICNIQLSFIQFRSMVFSIQHHLFGFQWWNPALFFLFPSVKPSIIYSVSIGENQHYLFYFHRWYSASLSPYPVGIWCQDDVI